MDKKPFLISIRIAVLIVFTLGIVGGKYDAKASSNGLRPLSNTIDFNSYAITPYGTQDVKPLLSSVEDGGATLHIKGNTWKKISFAYNVTPQTVIELDFKSPAQAQVHAIGFDNNTSLSPGYSFQMYGTQG